MKKKNISKLYNDYFLKNVQTRVEYGNIRNSFEYFSKYAVDKNLRILDIGSNIGSFPDLLYQNDWKNVYGIDVSEDAILFGKKKYPQIANNLLAYDGGKLPYGDHYFDVVTSFDVMEHILDLSEFLSEIFRILKPHGLFIFQTPNLLVNPFWEIVASKSLTEWRWQHCSLQTLYSLRSFLGKANFNNIIVEKFSISTEYNKKKINDKLGRLFIPLLFFCDCLPLFFTPNFWGACRKEVEKQDNGFNILKERCREDNK